MSGVRPLFVARRSLQALLATLGLSPPIQAAAGVTFDQSDLEQRGRIAVGSAVAHVERLSEIRDAGIASIGWEGRQHQHPGEKRSGQPLILKTGVGKLERHSQLREIREQGRHVSSA